MAFLQTEIFSQILHMAVTVDVILPQPVKKEIGLDSGKEREDRYPVLWLLHGASDDHTIWQRRTSIERYVAPMGLAVVMPNAHLSSYASMVHGGDFYRYVSEELPEILSQLFPLSRKREENYIAGNSMGGYGAMKIGINKPEQYSVIGCFSAAAQDGSLRKNKGKVMEDEAWDMRQFLLYGGKNMAGTLEDTWHMAEKNAGRPHLPRIYHTCGTDDFLIEDARRTRDFFESMEGNPYGYTYREHEGVHDWEYWDRYVQEFLSFISG